MFYKVLLFCFIRATFFKSWDVDGSLYILTEVDPLFLILPILERGMSRMTVCIVFLFEYIKTFLRFVLEYKLSLVFPIVRSSSTRPLQHYGLHSLCFHLSDSIATEASRPILSHLFPFCSVCFHTPCFTAQCPSVAERRREKFRITSRGRREKRYD